MSIRARVNKIKHLRNRYLICVIENPKYAINLASAIRNVCALGVEKIYVTEGYSGIPKTFEAARKSRALCTGSCAASRWTFYKHFETTEECFKHLRKNSYKIAATSPHLKGKSNHNLYEGTWTQKRLAVWFGNESKGISDFTADNCDYCIQIPMGGIVESLNLGTSTGIVLSYIREQRLNFTKNDSKRAKGNTKGVQG